MKKGVVTEPGSVLSTSSFPHVPVGDTCAGGMEI